MKGNNVHPPIEQQVINQRIFYGLICFRRDLQELLKTLPNAHGKEEKKFERTEGDREEIQKKREDSHLFLSRNFFDAFPRESKLRVKIGGRGRVTMKLTVKKWERMNKRTKKGIEAG